MPSFLPARRRVIVPLALISVAFLAGLWWGTRPARETTIPQVDGFLWPLLSPLEPFDLTAIDGAPFTRESLVGRWTLLTFGYSRCEEDCPATLSLLKSVAQRLGTGGSGTATAVVFVSLDAARDTPERLRRFLAVFDADFTAATAPPETLHFLARQFGVKYAKVSGEDPEDYWFEHAPEIFLVAPDARVVGAFSPPRTARGLAEDIARIIGFIERSS